MRTTAGVCIHCSANVEWDEARGAYVSTDLPGTPNLYWCGGPGGAHQVDEDEPEDDRTVRLVIEVDATILDPTWTAQELLDNAVHDIERALSEPADPSPAYRLGDDITLWTKEGYLLDLKEEK